MNKAAFFLILISFSISFDSLAQKEKDEEKKVKAQMWNNPPSEFSATAVPEKWKNESIVIMANSVDYIGDFTTRMEGLNIVDLYIEKILSHQRIKLFDKAAVKEYSQLKFKKNFMYKSMFGKARTYFFINAKIVKPDGTEKEVDLTQAVKGDIKDASDLKIAIPDLEPGDIIDYYYASRHEYTRGYENEVSENILLEGDYPIMKRTIRIEMPNKYSLQTRTFFGAPDFVKTDSEKKVIYTLTDEMRDKSPDLPWTYDHRSSPEVRFLKVTSSERSSLSGWEAKKPKTIAQNFLNSIEPNMSNIGFIVDYMKSNFKNEKDPAKISKEVYELLRNPIYLEAYMGIEQGHPLDVESVNSSFFRIFSKYLHKYKISHNLMVVPSRTYGDFDDQITIDADIMLRVNTNPPIYFPLLSPFSMPDLLPYVSEGMPPLTGETYPKNSPKVSSEAKTIPVSKASENVTTTVLNLSINKDDNSRLDVSRNLKAAGHNKAGNQYRVVTNYDYLKEYDKQKYQEESSSLIGGILKKYNKEKKTLEQRITQDYNDRDKLIKDDIEESIDAKVVEYKNFKLKSIGMWNDSPVLEFSDEYTLEDLSKKAGPNFILELPKLMEKQIQIEEKNKNRDRDIYMNFARTFKYEINFNIPEGYTVEGLENLNKDVQNKCGGFVSTAKVEGNVLKINSLKFYNENYYPKEQWNDILAFLNAAIDFTNAKVLVKKG